MQAIGLTEPFRTGSTRFRALLRRLHRDPVAGAYEDIQARFANAAAVGDVSEPEIRTIADLWGTPLDGPLRMRTVGLYRTFLRHCLDDHKLTERETAELEHLRRVLHLSIEDVELANRQVAREAYSRSVEQVLADATIDAEEREFLARLREVLGLPGPIADNIEAMKRRQRGARDRIPPKRSEL